MYFKSRKEPFLFIFLYAITLVLLGSSVTDIITGNGWSHIGVHIIVFLSSGFVLWILHHTGYLLTDRSFRYHCGPISGEIALERVGEIVVGKTMYVGLKPALARKGLIIKYDKYNDIYISPESNEEFIGEVLKRNDTIKITRISSSR
ncbi:PH domain-containing protein [Sinomicrobium weinanense]|uniref:PH domain-containing protein n=1 Tax=Sinomicrobium weinanense TaxID=2842200 RepID=A0A926Q282_9FLAO|nr:PH domain-containing protein [Sinomicrobium weinanense]MBC9796238.1 PH domain-containing protein [Sinomicrobium weinanense]MBU3122307.1 PH domain-containing protein [Sinomicrobium weinanense]